MRTTWRWKLALVVGGRADMALLDSYEEERVPVARRLLNTTDRAFKLIVSDSRLAGLFRTELLARVAAFAMSFERIQRFAFRVVSQTGIHYRNGPLSQTQDGLADSAPRAGDRFPWLRLRLKAGGTIADLFDELDDTRFNLLVVGQPPLPDAIPGLDELLRVHAIPDDADNACGTRARADPAAIFLSRAPRRTHRPVRRSPRRCGGDTLCLRAAPPRRPRRASARNDRRRHALARRRTPKGPALAMSIGSKIAVRAPIDALG